MSEAQTPNVSIHKFYLKDVSFESPKSPEVFLSQNWQPDISVEVDTNALALDGDNYEVSLTLTVHANQEEEAVFLCEVEQGGLFNLTGFDEEQIQTILGTFCPTQLFPFARNAISELIEKGGFPQLLLQPINFDQMYQQKMEAQQQSAH